MGFNLGFKGLMWTFYCTV